jgi:hypothetical protein
MSDEHLTDLERRLARWQPQSTGLDAEAMLFAAGRASVRQSPARFAWPAVAACLAIGTGILSVQLFHQRAAHRTILARMIETTMPVVSDQPPELPANSYLLVRRALERDPDFALFTIHAPSAKSSDQPIPHAGDRTFGMP